MQPNSPTLSPKRARKTFVMMLAAFMTISGIFSASVLWSADFSGKTIEFIIPFSEGGGSDKWSRFYAPLLSEALPGKPNVVVKNMPGAGSTKGANYFQQRAKPDGLTIFGTSGSTQFPYLLGDPRVQYRYEDWQVVLASGTGGVLYVSTDLGVNNMIDLHRISGRRDTTLIYGSQGATSLDLVPLLSFGILGIDLEAVFGMGGRGDGYLAFQRGEVNVDYQTTSSYLSKSTALVEGGEAVPLMAWGSLDANGNLVRDPNFPDLPTIVEVYQRIHGKKPSGPAWNAWLSFFSAGFPSQKMVFLPKGTSRDIVNTYTEAFDKVISAPGFQEQITKVLGNYPQATGNQAKEFYKVATTLSPRSRDWVVSWLNTEFDTDL